MKRTPKEFQRARRERRLGRTLDLEAEVNRWAAQRGFTLRVLNGGHHWLFQKPGLSAEWWPSSAKLVLNRDYLHDRHAPHWPDVASLLENALTATSCLSGPLPGEGTGPRIHADFRGNLVDRAPPRGEGDVCSNPW